VRLPLRRRPRELMLHIEKIEEAIEVETAEVAVAKEVDFKVEEAEDPKQVIKIVHMENVNHNTKRNKRMLKKVKRLRQPIKSQLMRRMKRRVIIIETMKLMKILTITSIIMLLDPNTLELMLLLRLKSLVSLPRKRERSNQIKVNSTRK